MLISTPRRRLSSSCMAFSNATASTTYASTAIAFMPTTPIRPSSFNTRSSVTDARGVSCKSIPCRRARFRMNAHSASSSDHLPFSSSQPSTAPESQPQSQSSTPQSSSAPPPHPSPSSSPTVSPSLPTSATTTKQPTRKFSIGGVFFLLITYIWSIILIIPMLIAHPLVLIFDKASRRFHDVIAMAWMRCSLWTVRVRPQVINAEKIPPPGTPVVYVANHSSYLDIFVFAYLFRRIKYVSKAEIFKIPIVGWAMQMAGNIALVRASARGQMQAYRQMVSVIRNGLSLVVFPEGTRSANGIMRRFKPGAFRAAKQNHVDVIPITILGTREVMPSTAYVPLRYPQFPISIVIHDPIDSKDLSINQLSEKAFKAIDSALPENLRSWDSEGRRLRGVGGGAEKGADNEDNESDGGGEEDSRI